MEIRKLFKDPPKEILELPINPKTLWYVSAGKDFRANYFFSNFNLSSELVNNNRKFCKPDLFVYNCLGNEVNELKKSGSTIIQDPGMIDEIDLFDDYGSIIYLHKYIPLHLDYTVINYGINPEYYNVNNCQPSDNLQNSKAFYLEVKLERSNTKNEIQRILYFEQENANFFKEVILRRFFNVVYLKAICEGIAGGCALQSIMQLIYVKGQPLFYTNEGLTPKHIILEKGGTAYKIFQGVAENSIFFEAIDYGRYTSSDTIIYELKYMNQALNFEC